MHSQGETEPGDLEVGRPITGAEVADVVKQVLADTPLQHCVVTGGSALGVADRGGGPFL